MFIKFLVCENIGPAVAGSAGPVLSALKLEQQSAIER